MSDLIAINDASIEKILYHDVPVVTFEQIAEVHGIPIRNVQRTFQRHRNRFIEGKHCFRLDYSTASELPLRVVVSHNGLVFFTEKGYLLLTKPLRDNKAWEVQERMVDDYFALKQEAVTEVTFPPPLSPLRQAEEDLGTWDRIGVLCGAPKHIALIEAAKDIQKRLGIDLSPMLQLSTFLDNIPDEDVMLEPTEIGKRLGMSGADLNRRLERAGMQARVGGEWVATDTGKEHCYRHAWKTGEKSGFNLKWDVEFVQRTLAQAAP